MTLDRLHNQFSAAEARQRCLRYRKRMLDVSQHLAAIHMAPALSALEITDACYNALMRRGEDGSFIDTFVMSKGHGYLCQATILEDLGIMPSEQMDSYGTPKSRLGGHPDHGVWGIEASTGSLGHGFGMAVGMAAADRIKGDDRRIYVIVGDGEMQEGSSWEAVMMAATLELKNLVVFCDYNDSQGLGPISESHPYLEPLAAKVKEFGWEVADVNGHDAEQIVGAVRGRSGERPFFCVCRTIKGRGVSYMENVPIWHYRSPNKDEYAQAIAELAEVAS